jgi:hypothetical protein
MSEDTAVMEFQEGPPEGFIEKTKYVGELHIQLFDENGNLKQEQTELNMLMRVGLAYIVSRMKDASATAMSHMGVGTLNTAAANTQTDLQQASGPTGGWRVALDSTTIVTTTTTNDTVQYVCTFPAGTGTGALIEAGLFNSGTNGAGTMLSRVVFAAGIINKGANDSLVITWKITAT